MKLILHEVELNSKDVESSKKFYHDLLGLSVHVNQEGIKVFDSGWPGLDLDASIHNPGKTTISFLVDDLDAFVRMLREKDYTTGEIYKTHLEMRGIELQDPDGNRIEIQSPTEKSPQYLHDMIRRFE